MAPREWGTLRGESCTPKSPSGTRNFLGISWELTSALCPPRRDPRKEHEPKKLEETPPSVRIQGI